MGTKDRILETAYQMFHEESYNQVSIDAICSKCSLSKPAFYYHFSSKADLLIHYYDDVVDHLYKTLKKRDFHGNYWEQFVFCFSSLIEASVSLGADLMKQLYIANLTEDKGSFNFNPTFSQLCIDLITKAQENEQIRNQQEPEALFIASSFMFTGVEVLWSIKDGGFERENNVIRALETVFDVAPKYSIQREVHSLNCEDFQ
ncbi:TetR/AcrR family transcriptional regulator [Enterococcus sp. AZ109]|uniref:TetR/AcrR family transcriptional regulator n=1 Tax=Enterococcus sp. AZ109 TaxID=2774634 RepID=UPI003F1FF983